MLRLSCLAIGLLFASACFNDDIDCGASFNDCDFDEDCRSGEICVGEGLGRECLDAQSCEQTSDCDHPAETCVSRPGRPPQNPFDDFGPGRQVCLCSDGRPCEGGGWSSTSSSLNATSSSVATTGGFGGGPAVGGGGGAGGGGGRGGAGGDGGDLGPGGPGQGGLGQGGGA